MTDDIVDRLERYVANHPDADIMEVLANSGADPTEYRDVVEQLLSGNSSDIHGLEKSTYPNTTDSRCDPESPAGSRSGSSQISVDADGAPHLGTVPSPLDDLGKSCVPIDPGEKGPRVPRTKEYLHEADDEILQAYLEAGHNYGVVTRGDLVVVDADEPDRLAPLLDALPETVQQVSGSRLSEHVFLFVHGLDEDIPLIDPDTEDELGHIKAAEQSIVVGPGSRHPSGNYYGPLEGDTIATVDQDDLREWIEPFRPREADRSKSKSTDWDDLNGDGGTGGDLSVHDVVSRRRYPEGERRDHPVHGSSTGSNFMVDEGGDTWRCWRHDCTGNALHLIGIEKGIISCGDWEHTGLDTDTWRAIFQAARDAGYDLPDYEPAGGYDGDRPPLLDAAIDRASEKDDVEIAGRPTSTLPLEQLDSLPPSDRRRFAKQRGLDWPSTDAARDRLFNTITEVIRNEDDRVVDAPTALGKSFTVASTRWGAREDITGGRPVVHLLETRDARDEAIDVAEEHGGSYHVLLGRHEACPVAAGEYDDGLTIDGTAASDWLDAQCNAAGKGMPFSAAHRYLEEHNDQGVDLPCCEEGECHAIKQWEVYREGPDDDLDYWPLVIATHNFAFAPGLRMQNNIIVDEEPNFTVDELSTGRIRDAVGAYLREIDAPIATWEAFIQLSRHDGSEGDAARERDALADAICVQPERAWYFEDPDAHVLAPAVSRAIFYAEDRSSGRRAGKTIYEPPRLEAQARDDDDWNREWVSVVLDETNDVQRVRVVPDFGAARSVVGLDAHPATPLWQVNTVPWIDTKEVLAPTERRLWRRYERGLRVVQVGDATRPLSGPDAPDWFDSDRKLDVELEHLVDEYGTQFRTAITTAQVEGALEERMDEAGCYRPSLMHFGEEKSRNDFAHESSGLVNGCMDPGDDFVLDTLAELDLDAVVETAVDDDGEAYRARGRGFEGEDAETAAEILASVRENHIAQAAGRYARNADDPESTATVFVRTDAIPTGFADVQVSGAGWVFTDLQEAIVNELRSAPGSLTAREIADAVGCSKEHVRTTLERLAESDDGAPPVQMIDGAGDHGATLYSDSGLPHAGVCDGLESPTDAYRTTSRWILAIRDATTRNEISTGGGVSDERVQRSVWEWDSPPDPGD